MTHLNAGRNLTKLFSQQQAKMLSRCKIFIACQNGSVFSIHYRCGFRANLLMRTRFSTASASSILFSTNLLSSSTRVRSLLIPPKSFPSCLNGLYASTYLLASSWIHQHHLRRRRSSHSRPALNTAYQNTYNHAVAGELSMTFLLGN